MSDDNKAHDSIGDFEMMEEVMKRAVERGILEPLLDDEGNQVWKVGRNGPVKVYRRGPGLREIGRLEDRSATDQ